MREMNSRAYCGAFNFKGGDQQKKVGLLSGGERNRVHMAKLLKGGRQRAAARRADQRPRRRDPARAGRRAGGFRRLRRGHLPRPLLPRPHLHPHPRLRGRGHVEWFEGNFEDYEEDKKRRLGPDALEPKRIKYKKFTFHAVILFQVPFSIDVRPQTFQQSEQSFGLGWAPAPKSRR
jgi:hypothetical protein